MLIEQKIFAEHIGVSPKTVSKLRTAGKIKGYGVRNQINEEEAFNDLRKIRRLDKNNKYIKKNYVHKEETIKQTSLEMCSNINTSKYSDQEIKDLAKKQKDENIQKQKDEIIKESIESFSDDDDDMVLSDDEKRMIYMAGIPNDLRLLIDGANSSREVTQITKDYWAGKLNQIRYEKEKGNLIEMNKSKGVMDEILTPINDKLNNLSTDLKNRFPSTHPDAIDWLSDQVNDMKKSVQDYQWGI